MKLEQYVSDILTNNAHLAGFPAYLDMPRSLVKYCWGLYQSGEKAGQEQGVRLYLRSGKVEIDTANPFKGTASGITINTDLTTNENFGDLHCHPSNSIGHVNGYAAHSGEDFLAMEKNTTKPVFIGFVASGTRIYAAVYRNGYTQLVKNTITGARDHGAVTSTAYFKRHCPVDEATLNQQLADCSSSKQMDQYLLKFRRDTPGLGKEM